MSRLARWFPLLCSRLKIFVCYAHEDRKLADEIAQALINDGHEVFIDANKLKVSGDFNTVIRRAIESADRFIFLISKASMGQGKYPQTELDFAKDRWPSPHGVVWPVLVDPSIEPGSLPVYLRAVQIHTVKGNAPAEIAAAIEKSRTVRPRCKLCAVAALAALIGGAVFLLFGGPESTNYALLPPQQVDFRPAKKPGPDTDWAKSRLMVTLIPVQYANESGAQVRILDETATITIGDRAVPFKWFNEVELKNNCGTEWLCVKGSVGADTLQPGGTLRRETMFMPAPGEKVSWQDFLESVCVSKENTLDVKIASNLSGATLQSRTAMCRVNLKVMRDALVKLGCKTGLKQTPARMSPQCAKL